MKYAMLIYTNESQDAQRTEAVQEANMGAYFDFTNEINEAGINIGGEALMPTSMATSVQVRDGETITTDGPFAETKEQLGGFYLLECKDLDEAIAYAAKIPGAWNGTVEVRPIMEFE
ncbi:MAG: YciI family protein [Chloroflexota bacterium]